MCDGKLTAWDVSNLSYTGRSVGVERLQPPANQNPELVPS